MNETLCTHCHTPITQLACSTFVHVHSGSFLCSDDDAVIDAGLSDVATPDSPADLAHAAWADTLPYTLT